MNSFQGETLSWEFRDGVLELTLDHAPVNEIGSALLADLEKFVASFPALEKNTAACIFTSARKAGFSAGADLRELYQRTAPMPEPERVSECR